MKKYLLSTLLGVFGLVGAFASADTVGNYSSDSSICTYSFSSSSSVSEQSAINTSCAGDGVDGNYEYYLCLSSSDVPYTVESYFDGNTESTFSVSDSNYCFPVLYRLNDASFHFNKEISGTFYISSSAITYNAPSQGGGGSGGLGDLGTSDGILSGGLTTLGSVLTSLSDTINEFIPYLVYMGLGILIVTLGFVAIKWLVNWTSRRVTGFFSSRRGK